ncbi:MAG: carbohydrate kinase family protein [Deltaproteobacteria bacterium]|nr:carbohydrate kinase family protein [Deltaproteobacteria bacterium]
MKIFTSGSLAYDRIMDFPGEFEDHILPEKIHILNVCFMVNGLTEKFGGTAGNIAYSLSLLGEKPLILATAGKDFDSYETRLRQQNLSLTGIRRIPEEFTAGAYITTDKSDNQITGFNPGAMKYPSLYKFDGVDRKEAIAIIAPGNIEDMINYGRTYKKHRIPYIFDPGQSIPALSGDQMSEIITGSEMLISNDYELEMIKKATGLEKPDLIEMTKSIITTLGEEGSIVCYQRQETKIPSAKALTVSDPTGAGDAYRAGMIKGMVMGKDLVTSAKMGAVCASFSVEHHGTQEHKFTQKDFWSRYKTN